jgi:hypothetical protein
MRHAIGRRRESAHVWPGLQRRQCWQHRQEWWQLVPSLGTRKGAVSWSQERWQHYRTVATTVAPLLAYAAYPTGGYGRGLVASWHRCQFCILDGPIKRADTVERCHGRCRGCATTADVVVLTNWGVVRWYAVSSDQFMPRCHGGHGQSVQLTRRIRRPTLQCSCHHFDAYNVAATLVVIIPEF